MIEGKLSKITCTCQAIMSVIASAAPRDLSRFAGEVIQNLAEMTGTKLRIGFQLYVITDRKLVRHGDLIGACEAVLAAASEVAPRGAVAIIAARVRREGDAPANFDILDAYPPAFAAARNARGLTDQASQAMPADPGRPSYEATGTPPQPTEPSSQPDDGGDYPAGTGS